jgi:hypothetical protein
MVFLYFKTRNVLTRDVAISKILTTGKRFFQQICSATKRKSLRDNGA